MDIFLKLITKQKNSFIKKTKQKTKKTITDNKKSIFFNHLKKSIFQN